jgi:hypothetical protein
MDCRIGEGGRVKKMRIGIENSGDQVDNTEIKKKERKKRNTIKNTRFRNLRKFSLLIKVPELFLNCLILMLVFK